MGEAKAKKMNALKKQTTLEENGGREFFARFSELKEHVKEYQRVSEINFSYEIKEVVDVDRDLIKLRNGIKALLYQMKQLTKKQNSVLSQFEQNLHSFFTLLYGLCSGLTSFIFNAFTGASLARILA